MTFNVLLGGEDRLPAILEIIAKSLPDLLVLQECLGWEDGKALAEVANVMRVPPTQDHAILGRARPRGSGSCYHVSLASRFPLRDVAVFNDRSFLGHALVRCHIEIGGRAVTLFGTHFDSHHENLRFVEARYLRSLIDRAVFGTDFLLLVGDLNSLSPQDPYPNELAHSLVASGTNKFGHPPRFEVVSDLLDFGWVDTLRSLRSHGKWATAVRDRGGVLIELREDYIFASPALSKCLASVEIVDAGSASDHSAVVAEFDLGKT
jgi:exodeoxyribonuclease-3